MLLNEKKKVDVEPKELRVKIGIEYHLKLHALKLLRGKNMREAVEEALDHYFEHTRAQDLLAASEKEEMEAEEAVAR